MQKNRAYVYTFALVLVLSLLIFLLFRLAIFKPVISLGQNLLIPIFSYVRASEDKKSQETLLSLSQKLVDQSKIQEDNRALRDQFQTSSVPTQALIEAKIVGMPTFIPGVTLPEYYILDKGSSSQIKKGQSVIYKDNLVGFVTETSENFSRVELISNSTFSQTAQTVPSSILGVAKGQGAGRIVLDNVVLSSDLKKGELVVTKGDQNIEGEGVLPNLVIGKIVSINKNPSSLFQLAKIESLLDFTHLSTVFIVK
jgi:rod shape-determining protein MreC